MIDFTRLNFGELLDTFESEVFKSFTKKPIDPYDPIDYITRAISIPAFKELLERCPGKRNFRRYRIPKNVKFITRIDGKKLSKPKRIYPPGFKAKRYLLRLRSQATQQVIYNLVSCITRFQKTKSPDIKRRIEFCRIELRSRVIAT